ncbi:DUF2797 domain-containing protein [Aliivibrio kagoshimensis]|uniref:DUF2797 domain-containing protein n=1 Tax=Aliivibrio kagoshimensis TaxID=2910230 RepID=UPI003D0FEC90
MSNVYTGTLRKMTTTLNPDEGSVCYHLPVGEHSVNLTELIGQSLTLNHTGNIYCSNCSKKTKKSYSQGHCYVCMKKLASCDMCMMKPETCHFDQGTCREPEWAEQVCMSDHYVYLSNTSSLKVGITRHTQIPTRWIDQGATQALPIFKVSNRKLSGLIEIELAKQIADKTNWRTLLKGNAEDIDLKAKASELIPIIHSELAELQERFGDASIEQLDSTVINIGYDVSEFPTKITSHNFDKQPEVLGTLIGIKGQYLIFDTGVINIRKFGSYEVTVSY